MITLHDLKHVTHKDVLCFSERRFFKGLHLWLWYRPTNQRYYVVFESRREQFVARLDTTVAQNALDYYNSFAEDM